MLGRRKSSSYIAMLCETSNRNRDAEFGHVSDEGCETKKKEEATSKIDWEGVGTNWKFRCSSEKENFKFTNIHGWKDLS